MKGTTKMKIKLKRALSAILCGVLLSTCTAYASDTEANSDGKTVETVTAESSGEAKKESTSEAQTSPDALRYDPKDKYPVYAGYKPDYSHYASYNYDFFLELVDLYSSTHLYEFTSEEAKEAFLMKLIKENPDLMKLFLDTLLGTMDEYSAYFEAGTGLDSDGSTRGYGVLLSQGSDGRAYFSEIYENSPAGNAGLKAGDRIVAIEGIPVEGLTIDGVNFLLKHLPYVGEELFDANGVSLGIPNEPEFIINELSGQKEYPIHIDVERNGEIISVKMLMGRVVHSDVIYQKNEEKKYGYISISSFSKSTVCEDFRNALTLAKKECNGNLIIDLRDNTGGRIEFATEMAGYLVPDKDRVLYYINSRQHDKPEPIYSQGIDYGFSFDKIVILTNEYTASAAELFSSVLSYHCGAMIVGVQTYGKAVGQQSYRLTNGDMFTVTSIEMLDPLGRSYNNVGLTPDVEIDITMRRGEFKAPEKELTADALQFLTEGAESDGVYALQERLTICGFMAPGHISGKYDTVTDAALKAFLVYTQRNDKEPVTEKTLESLNRLTQTYENYYYYYDSQLDVAEFALSSRSQAKRRVSELEKENKKITAMYNEWQAAQAAKIKEELRAEKEAEKQAEQNADSEANEGTQAPAQTEIVEG